MADAIIRELWKIKDAIAQEHNRDVDSLVASLKNRPRPQGQRRVDLSGVTGRVGQGASTNAGA